MRKAYKRFDFKDAAKALRALADDLEKRQNTKAVLEDFRVTQCRPSEEIICSPQSAYERVFVPGRHTSTTVSINITDP